MRQIRSSQHLTHNHTSQTTSLHSQIQSPQPKIKCLSQCNLSRVAMISVDAFKAAEVHLLMSTSSHLLSTATIAYNHQLPLPNGLIRWRRWWGQCHPQQAPAATPRKASIRGDYTGAGCLLENAIKRCTPHNKPLTQASEKATTRG
jgi:hypothetical protein